MKLDEPVAGDTPPRRDRIILASLLLLVRPSPGLSPFTKPFLWTRWKPLCGGT
jgi:hypothetical protein